MKNFFYGVLAGAPAWLLLGWYLWHPAPAPIEKPAAAIKVDYGMILERSPLTHISSVPPAVEKATKSLPGGKLERVIKIKVQPKLDTVKAECAPVNIDLGLVRMPDDSHRVIATSMDGEVVGGVDIPISGPRIEKPLKWAAGAIYTSDKQYGAFLDRDVGPFRVGVDVVKQSGFAVTGMVRVGIRF